MPPKSAKASKKVPPPKAGAGPDLKPYMDKKLALKLNKNRKIVGVLRGYDQFMNIVLEEAVEEVSSDEQNQIGMVVIRGNAIEMVECLERMR